MYSDFRYYYDLKGQDSKLQRHVNKRNDVNEYHSEDKHHPPLQEHWKLDMVSANISTYPVILSTEDARQLLEV